MAEFKESIIDQLNNTLYDLNYTLGTRRATDWLVRKLKSIHVDRNKLMRDNERLTDRLFIGQMFLLFYDPKWKHILPYYDTAPLIIPIKIDGKGFEGLNLHYISPRERVAFLRQLVGYTNNKLYDETTRFRLSYNLLKGVSALDAFKPCYKRYLWGHVRSQFLQIDAHEWYMSALLPVANFQKMTEQQVWRESRKIRKNS
jgi:hypothetical protein